MAPREAGDDGDHNAGCAQRILTTMSGGIPMSSRAINASSNAVAVAANALRKRSTHPFTSAMITRRPNERQTCRRPQTALLLEDANRQHVERGLDAYGLCWRLFVRLRGIYMIKSELIARIS
jgi:hypothetical protein